ncbi:MAG: ECF-type sigma factor [Gemmatimonadota bacterium]
MTGPLEPEEAPSMVDEPGRAGSRVPGDDVDALVPAMYEELRKIAHRHLRRERAGHTLNTTALVHESYLSLAGSGDLEWQSRAHFCAVASRAMRHILVDYARRRSAAKRGGARIQITLAEGMAADEDPAHDLLALDEALERLAAWDERLARVVECRFFGGMTVDETAEALGTSRRTVERDWTRAKAYLYRMLVPAPDPEIRRTTTEDD